MDKNATYYETLITRYLSGETTAAEVSELSTWLRADTENLRLFREMRKVWSFQESFHLENTTDLDNEWNALAEKIGITDAPVSRNLHVQTRRRFIRVAAILLLLIIPSMLYLIFFMQPGEDRLYAEQQMIESTLPDGTEVALNAGSSLHYPSTFKGKERKNCLLKN